MSSMLEKPPNTAAPLIPPTESFINEPTNNNIINDDDDEDYLSSKENLRPRTTLPLAVPVAKKKPVESNPPAVPVVKEKPTETSPLSVPVSKKKPETETDHAPTPTQPLYRYQKPITVEELKHPHEKYRDLIYKPRFLTSRNIEPPTETLVPKFEPTDLDHEADNLAPLSSFRSSRFGVKKPRLVDDLKLPLEKKVFLLLVIYILKLELLISFISGYALETSQKSNTDSGNHRLSAICSSSDFIELFKAAD